MCKGCHVVVCKVRVKSLIALAKAVQRLGGELKLHQKTYKWFGRWVDDYHKEDAAYKQGVATDDYGRCDHAIHFPGCRYEMGLIADGDGYKLIFDFIDGNLTHTVGGRGADKLMQMYAVEAAREQAAMNCHNITGESVMDNGTIQLHIEVSE
jgi:hypothetical protein